MTPRRNSRLFPLMFLLGGGVLLGLSVNFAKLGARVGLTPLAFLSWSITGAAAMLLILAMLRGSPPPITKPCLQYYAISALVGVAGPNLVFFAAIPHVGAGFVALIITLPPLLTYIGALAFGMENFQAIRATGVAAALAGAGVLGASQLAAPDAEVFWILLVFVGPVLLAIGNLYRTLHWPAGVSADALAPGMLLGAAIMLLLVGLLPGNSLAIPLGSGPSVILIAAQAVVFAGQFLLLFLLQKTGGPVLLSLLGSVGAVVGVPIAIFLQDEAAPQGLLPGAGLIAIGVILVARGQSRRLGERKSKRETNVE
jgi:drug/metabolite transporter (DMT)-like permease